MTRLRALTARVPHVPPTLVRIRLHTFVSTRGGRHACAVWIEDHAELLILTTLVLLVGSFGTLLLWKTARVISLAREFEPVLGVVAALTTISLAALNVLKSRRDRRLQEPDDRQLSSGPTAPPARATGKKPPSTSQR